jgi:hypothetical protein
MIYGGKMKFDLSTRKPVGSSQVTCETAQRVNREILSGHPPEDKELVSQVIAHTALCDECRANFLGERFEKKTVNSAKNENRRN